MYLVKGSMKALQIASAPKVCQATPEAKKRVRLQESGWTTKPM